VEIIGIVVNEKARSGRLRPRSAYARFSVLHLADFLQIISAEFGRCHRGTGKIEKKAESRVGTVVYIDGVRQSLRRRMERRQIWRRGLLELQEIRTISLADTVGWRRRRKFRKWFRR